MSISVLDRRIATVRRFNRFYTKKIGVLSEAFLNTPYSLTEARVLHLLAHRDGATATWLGQELDLDPGYLSHILRDFERQKLIFRNPSPHDGRQILISLTPAGRDAYEPLDRASQSDIGNLLAPLAEADQERLVGAMRTLSTLLGDAPEARPALHPAVAPARRYGLGDAAARRALQSGIRAQRPHGVLRRRSRRQVPARVRPGA